jgi:hypothetical protein
MTPSFAGSGGGSANGLNFQDNHAARSHEDMRGIRWLPEPMLLK